MCARWIGLLVVALVCAGVGCRQRVLPAQETPSPDNEYLDLAAGGRLSITVPRFKSGGYVAQLHAVEQTHGLFTVSSDDFIGFEVSQYAVLSKPDGRVRLKFESAESARDGKLTPEKKAPELPFALPRGYRHIRLIYFVRSSQTDHNMAIAAGKDASAMDKFTRRMHGDPRVCDEGGTVSCVWVPAGVAVRTE